MKKVNVNPNLTQVSVLVPKLFLKHFDQAIEGFFQGRSEAIRRGMNLVLEEIQRLQNSDPNS